MLQPTNMAFILCVNTFIFVYSLGKTKHYSCLATHSPPVINGDEFSLKKIYFRFKLYVILIRIFVV